jgi:hypothetical protein
MHMRNTDLVAKMIHVRDVPDRLHGELVRCAKARGKTLTDYIEEILEREVARPPAEEIFARVRKRRPVRPEVPAADLIREERARREGSSHCS